eukprot:gene1039-1377_t
MADAARKREREEAADFDFDEDDYDLDEEEEGYARAPRGQLATKTARKQSVPDVKTARKSIPLQAARRSTPLASASAESTSRDDGWGIYGQWAVMTNDKSYGTRAPLSWSFFSDGEGISFFTFDNGPFCKLILCSRMSCISRVRFSWRGREKGEGEIQTDFDGQTGDITFKQQEGGFMVMEGRMQGPFCESGGLMFIGFRVRDTPKDTDHDWSFYSYEQHEQERVARWR